MIQINVLFLYLGRDQETELMGVEGDQAVLDGHLHGPGTETIEEIDGQEAVAQANHIHEMIIKVEMM